MGALCKMCGEIKPASGFYNGVMCRCKECHKRMARENRAEKREYYKEYDAKRFASDPRVRERHIKYRATESGKKSIKASRERWVLENPEKRAAHIILGNKVRSGEVKKPLGCSVCGASGRIEGHHEDYDKPLNVIWVCRRCHIGIHAAASPFAPEWRA